MTCLLAAAALAGAPISTASMAQTPEPEAASTLDDVIVTARRAGAPMWTVERGDSVVILIGSIEGVPRDYAWRPEALEAATRESRRILYPMEARASAADILRMLWRIRTIARLPNGTTIADHVPPELLVRLERLKAEERSDSWRTESLIGLSFDLLRDAGRERRGRGAPTVVRDAARAARIPGEPVGVVRGDELIDNLITLPPSTYLRCVEVATTAAEAGPAGAAARLDAWSGLRVREVLANPLDQALGLCWPSGDPDIAPVVRTRWAEATNAALDQPGVTLGVAPLRILAEPGGVLDQLEAQGLDPRGPEWKPAP
ncbi:TraB/GumN family protein [Brevundimonas sp. BR2-1]|uniref:TraB/GumN family protein n=1 Tax=Brevundimonas sp. BR2-1 TaxID=3031123 RepID=UPI0030B18757